MERNCNKCKNPDCLWVGANDDEICDEYLPKTNWDRIRLMAVEEFAVMYMVLTTRFGTYDREELLEWLQEEVDE